VLLAPFVPASPDSLMLPYSPDKSFGAASGIAIPVSISLVVGRTFAKAAGSASASSSLYLQR
jgi:hypothetical protein